MMSTKDESGGAPPAAGKQQDAGSKRSADQDRMSDRHGGLEQSTSEEPRAANPEGQPTAEEFGERGMGVAAKE